MSGHIDTREGWRELDVVTPDSIYQLAEYDPADGSVVRAWVREVPVPLLPTEPYTVIRVTWGDDGPTWPSYFILTGWGWFPVDSFNPTVGGYTGPPYELDPITGFEVLAEPRKTDLAEFTSDPLGVVRRQTAKAILDRVRQVRGIPWGLLDVLDDVAREFGVGCVGEPRLLPGP